MNIRREGGWDKDLGSTVRESGEWVYKVWTHPTPFKYLPQRGGILNMK